MSLLRPARRSGCPRCWSQARVSATDVGKGPAAKAGCDRLGRVIGVRPRELGFPLMVPWPPVPVLQAAGLPASGCPGACSGLLCLSPE